jgi:hypothetical protein
MISDRDASVARVFGAGWPYSLSVPTEMTATVGRIASRRPGVVDESEPWCPTLSRSTGDSRPRTPRMASIGASASPVSRAAKPPWRTSITIEPLLMSPSGSGAAASASVG